MFKVHYVLLSSEIHICIQIAFVMLMLNHNTAIPALFEAGAIQHMNVYLVLTFDNS